MLHVSVEKISVPFLKTIRVGQRKCSRFLHTIYRRKTLINYKTSFTCMKYDGKSCPFKSFPSNHRTMTTILISHTIQCPNILQRGGLLNCSHRIQKVKQESFQTTVCKWNDSSIFTEDLSDNDLEILQDKEYDEHVKEIIGSLGDGHNILVIHPDVKGRSSLTTAQLQLEEACTLINTLQDWTVADRMIYPVKENLQFIFGKRQMAELTEYLKVNRQKFSAVFLNVNILKINQMALFKGVWKIPVYDRYSIVLQIFKENAQTKTAKIQVALAEIPYIRDRLIETDQHKHGGSHGTRHIVRFGGFKSSYIHMTDILMESRERKLRAALEKLKQHRNMLWSNRQKKDIPTVAVVGYTNSGKTTLIKALTGDDRLEPCNQLFATLDVTMHAGRLDNNMSVLYIDTIGFISNIPMGLLSAFSATLQDAVLADVILHVRDISHPDTEAQYANVMSTLQSILPPDKMEKVIVVCNKTDRIQNKLNEREGDKEDMFISAVTGLGLGTLKDKLQTSLLESCDLLQKKFRVPFDGEHFSWLYKEATVTATDVSDTNDSLIVHTIISKTNYERFKHRFGRKKNS